MWTSFDAWHTAYAVSCPGRCAAHHSDSLAHSPCRIVSRLFICPASPAPSPHHAASAGQEAVATPACVSCGAMYWGTGGPTLPRLHVIQLQRRIHNDGLLVVGEHVPTHLRLQGEGGCATCGHALCHSIS
jgi:hypothetical protein